MVFVFFSIYIFLLKRRDIFVSKLEGDDMSVKLKERMLYKSNIYITSAVLTLSGTSEGGLFLYLISGCSSASCVFI